MSEADAGNEGMKPMLLPLPLGQPQVPQVFFDGFSNSFTATEISTVASHGSRLLLSFVMHPSVAKSFATALADTVSQYERATGQTVLTVQELSERISSQTLAAQKNDNS